MPSQADCHDLLLVALKGENISILKEIRGPSKRNSVSKFKAESIGGPYEGTSVSLVALLLGARRVLTMQDTIEATGKGQQS